METSAIGPSYAFSVLMKWLLLWVVACGFAAPAPKGGFYSVTLANAQSLQGSEIDIRKPLSEVVARVEEVFKVNEIRMTLNRMDESGNRRVIRGRRGNTSVEVQLTQKSHEETHISVVSKRGLVAIDRDLSQQLIEQIIHPN